MVGRLRLSLVQPFNLLIIIGLSWLAYKKVHEHFHSFFELQLAPILPSIVMVLASSCYVFIDNLYGIQTFKSVFALFFFFGFIGLFVSQVHWRAVSMPILMLFIVLPFGSLLDTYIGFPLRLYTADSVSSFLSQIGLLVSDRQTILGLENRYTQIDNTCSGINVLWAGTLLYLAFALLDNLVFNLKWFLIYVMYVALLLAFNMFRIGLLVVLDIVFSLSRIADAIHQPLGIVGFVLPSVICWLLLARYGTKRVLLIQKNKISQNIARPLLPLTVIVGLLILAGFPLRKTPNDLQMLDSKLVHTLEFDTLPLAAKEQAYFDFENAQAQKFLINYKSIKGTLIIVSSNSFKGHHNPELCLQSIGLAITRNNSILIHQKPVRLLTFANEKLNGVFWFKNQNIYTDDYSYRVWHDIKNGNKQNRWIQVTALFHQNYNTNDLHDFFTYINQHLPQK